MSLTKTGSLPSIYDTHDPGPMVHLLDADTKVAVCGVPWERAQLKPCRERKPHRHCGICEEKAMDYIKDSGADTGSWPCGRTLRP